jgi:hypothetical protein
MAAYKFTISRRSIYIETYEVEADSEAEALEICYDGEASDMGMDWVDWYDDRYEVDERITIDPLIKMLEDHKPQIG